MVSSGRGVVGGGKTRWPGALTPHPLGDPRPGATGAISAPGEIRPSRPIATPPHDVVPPQHVPERLHQRYGRPAAGRAPDRDRGALAGHRAPPPQESAAREGGGGKGRWTPIPGRAYASSERQS